MMMGDLLAAARDSSGGFEAWLRASDPALWEEAAAASVRSGQSVTGYVRSSVADFARLAAEEDWATLMSSLRDSGDPGTVCLTAMLHWRLNAATCGHHHPQKAQGAPHERSA